MRNVRQGYYPNIPRRSYATTLPSNHRGRKDDLTPSSSPVPSTQLTPTASAADAETALGTFVFLPAQGEAGEAEEEAVGEGEEPGDVETVHMQFVSPNNPNEGGT